MTDRKTFMKAPRILVFVLCLISALGVYLAQAQDSLVGAVVAVKAERLLDVRSGNYLSDQLILIENGKVREVGKAADVQHMFRPARK